MTADIAITSRSVPAAAHLRLEGITKRFGSVVANEGVDLKVAAGTIHAVVGENGAGKTTLMRIVYGLERPDAGSVEVNGARVEMRSPQVAIAHGIGMVQQHVQLISGLTALENLVLGREPSRLGAFNAAAARRQAGELADRLHTRIDWYAPVERLSVGHRQRLEIMRLLYRDAGLLIFDEPTTVLTPGEVDDLFAVLRSLAADGRTILFISHKLREVLAIAERVTVMRRGRVVATVESRGTDAGQLARLMIGEAPEPVRATGEGATVARRPPRDEAALALEGCAVDGPGGRRLLDGIDLAVRAGEIVGVAGIEGNGQRELIDIVLGMRRPRPGRVTLGGRDVTHSGVRARRRLGISYIPEDRNVEGADLAGSISTTAICLRYDRPPLSRAGILSLGSVRAFTRGLIERFGIVAAGPDAPMRSLSGGNAQRLVVGREIDASSRCVLAAHPTRGVDVKGIAFIHEQLLRLRGEGTGILLISEELAELFRLADRIVVLYEGQIVGEFARDAVDIDHLSRLMTGVETGGAAA
ncbi:MAG: heme ABC transporter ATP-binding protein [Anaerolinea sp.]|nr:heme ABC transporter ATP-binding protein [Anaerolinea sp.]